MKKQEGTAMNPLKMKNLAAWILCALAGASAALPAAPVSPRRTTGAPNVRVSGTVTDGSGHGWPLYARIDITSASTEPLVAYTDPVSGAYAADLPDGIAYTFVVTAVGPGYVSGGGPVTTAGSPVVANWTLIVGALCSAPGYGPGTVRAVGVLRKLRRRRPSAGLERGHGLRRELADLRGRGSLPVLRREPHGRVRSLRARSTATATATSSSRRTRTS